MSDRTTFTRQSQETPKVPAGKIIPVIPFAATPPERYYLIRYHWRKQRSPDWEIANSAINEHPVEWLVSLLTLQMIGGEEYVLDFAMKISKEQYEALKDLL